MAKLGDVESVARHGSVYPAATDVRQFTDAAIMALTQWNAAALDLLARDTSGPAENFPAAQALAAAADQHRLLGALLQETERNLRIFRDTSRSTEFPSSTGK